jgi:hypothetical protein
LNGNSDNMVYSGESFALTSCTLLLSIRVYYLCSPIRHLFLLPPSNPFLLFSRSSSRTYSICSHYVLTCLNTHQRTGFKQDKKSIQLAEIISSIHRVLLGVAFTSEDGRLKLLNLLHVRVDAGFVRPSCVDHAVSLPSFFLIGSGTVSPRH